MGTVDMSWLLGWQQGQPSSQPQPWQEQPVSDWSENSEMYKKVIDALMAKVQAKYGELNAAKFSWDNQNAAQRNDILKTIFETMKASGVDPWDPQAINEFMAELEQDSPDLFELFTEALNALLGPEVAQAQAQWQVDTTIPPEGQPQSPDDPTQSPEDPTQSPADPTQSPSLNLKGRFPNIPQQV